MKRCGSQAKRMVLQRRFRSIQQRDRTRYYRKKKHPKKMNYPDQ